LISFKLIFSPGLAFEEDNVWLYEEIPKDDLIVFLLSMRKRVLDLMGALWNLFCLFIGDDLLKMVEEVRLTGKVLG
jgi:hypothetical protein